MKRISVGQLLTALALGTGTAWCATEQEITLKVGDPAPKLLVSKWVRGEPVKALERDKAYIVEFWATWCGPCRATIPHLNDLHKKYLEKGLVVIGQNVWERNLAAVPGFIKSMGDKMTYRVALDDTEGSERGRMAETWMAAAGQNGIPAAFVVDKQGKIAWIGHPMQLQETILDQVLAGTYDLEKAAASYAVRVKNEAQLHNLWRRLSGQMRSQAWDQAESTLGDIEKLTPEEERDELGLTRFGILMGKGDYGAAFKLARGMSDANPKHSMLQNDLAWAIATMEAADRRDLDLAELIATRANKAAEGKNPAILDTLARVLFLKGEKNKAMEVQQEAIDLAEGRMKEQLRKVLDSYRDGKVPEE